MRIKNILKEGRAIIPLAIPYLFALAYAPLNRTIVVRTFGCGCPVISGETGEVVSQFNANHFNAIIYALVFVASIVLAFVWSKGQPRVARIVFLVFAVAFIGFSMVMLYPVWK